MSGGTWDLLNAWTFHSFRGQAGLSHSAKASFAHFGGLDEAVLPIFSCSFQAALRELKQGRAGALLGLRVLLLQLQMLEKDGNTREPKAEQQHSGN